LNILAYALRFPERVSSFHTRKEERWPRSKRTSWSAALPRQGYLDQALELFTRNADGATAQDWMALRDKLLERGRIQDMVRVCDLGHVPIRARSCWRAATAR